MQVIGIMSMKQEGLANKVILTMRQAYKGHAHIQNKHFSPHHLKTMHTMLPCLLCLYNPLQIKYCTCPMGALLPYFVKATPKFPIS